MDYKDIDTLREGINGLSKLLKEGTPIATPEEMSKHLPTKVRIHQDTAKIAQAARSMLLDALQAAEAGNPLPPYVRECIADLNALEPLLSIHESASLVWSKKVGGLLTSLAPYAEGNNPTPRRYYLNTNKSQEELANIHDALRDRGYIIGAYEDFINAFAPEGPQGRIRWIGTARNNEVCPAHILDFVELMAGNSFNPEDKEVYKAVAAIFSVSISRHIISRFKKGNGTEVYADLATIINT